MGCFRPVLATRYTPNRGLLGLSRQSLEDEFHEVRGSKVDFEVDLRGIGVGLRGMPAFMFGVRVLGSHIASNEQARV
jgi:hypothetical protein